MNENRIWAALLAAGSILAGSLLVREIADYAADAGKPALRQNDVVAALESVAMLLIIGLVAFVRSRRHADGSRRSGARRRKAKS